MTDTQPRSPFSRPGFIASAVVIGVIVLAAIVVLVTSIVNGDNGDVDATPTPSTSEPASPSASAEPTEDPADASVCGLEGFEEESSLDTAPTSDWELVGTVAAPSESPTGPGVIDSSGFRSCYAHTAEGALFAAVGYFAVSSDVRNTSRLHELLAAGPVKDQLDATPPAADPSATRLQVAGFKVDRYSPTEATIDVAWSVTSEGGTLVSFPTVLRWEEGDWKVVISENGPPFAPTALENLGGYIPWAGV